MLSGAHYISIALTLAAFTAVGFYSVRFIKKAEDFSVGGRKFSAPLIAGSLVGSFVGGTSTIGTAQMAYTLGVTAVWFTLGAGISCMIMGLAFARPLREAQVDTVPQLLEKGYGTKARFYSSLYISLGMLIQTAAQVMAAVPVITALTPLPPAWAALLVTVIIVSYVFFGGFWGTSLVGTFKMVLIILTMLLAGSLALYLAGGLQKLSAALPPGPWMTPFALGPWAGIASGFSVIVGFTSTQSYLQAIFAGKDVRTCRRGAFAAALLIPLAGFGATLAGMFMRTAHPGIPAAEALPRFLILYLPPWLGGVAIAVLIISLIMTAAGLVIGISTIISQNIYRDMFRPLATDRQIISANRIIIILLAAVVFIFTAANLDSLILNWAFLSMTLRGTTVFFPLLWLLLLPGGAHPRLGAAAVIFAPSLALLWAIFSPLPVDPLYIGLPISLGLLLAGTIKNKHQGLSARSLQGSYTQKEV